MSNLTLTLQTETFQYAENGRLEKEDVLTANARAVFRETSEGWALSYGEKDENGSTVTRLTFSRDGGVLSLSRQGALSYNARFTVNGTDVFLYRAFPASWEARTETLALTQNLSSAGGALFLSYRLTMGGVAREIHLQISAVPEGETAKNETKEGETYDRQ